MQIAIYDVEQLRFFAEALEEQQRALNRQRHDRVEAADAIKSKWDDSTYRTHRRTLDEVLSELEKFELACQVHSDFLHRKYRAAMDVLLG